MVMDVMREAVEERAGDRGWIPGYLQVAPDGRLHLVSCAPCGLIVAGCLVSDAGAGAHAHTAVCPAVASAPPHVCLLYTSDAADE